MCQEILFFVCVCKFVDMIDGQGCVILTVFLQFPLLYFLNYASIKPVFLLKLVSIVGFKNTVVCEKVCLHSVKT